jgi:hypothetical protein
MLQQKMKQLAAVGDIRDYVTGKPMQSLKVAAGRELSTGMAFGKPIGEVPSRVALEAPTTMAERQATDQEGARAGKPQAVMERPEEQRGEQLRLPEMGEDLKPYFDRLKREGTKLTDQDQKTLLKIADVEGKDSPAFANGLQAATQPKTWLGKFLDPNRLLYMWEAGLLSKPVTWTTKALGDAAIQSIRVPERSMAGLIDQARSAGWFDLPFLRVKGGQQERFIQEGLQSARGSLAAMPKAMHTIADAITKGEGLDWQQQGRLENQISPMRSKLGRAVFGFPFKMMGGITSGAVDVAKSGELFTEAYRTARQEGLRDGSPELTSRMQEILNAPDKIPGLIERVAAQGKTLTYGDPLVGMAKAFSDQVQKNPLLSLLAPFIKVPTNIARQAWMRTPAGFYKVIRAAQRGELKGGEFSEQLAKPVIGSLIMGTIGALAAEGMVTGGGPTDPRKASNLRSTGWQPYSFKVGDNYISYRRIEPFASLIGTSADVMEGVKNGDMKSAGAAAKKGIDSVEANFTNKLYFTGMEDFFQAIRDPERALGTWVKQMEGSVVPGIVASAAQVADPTIRKTQISDLSPITSRIPGLSQGLEPRVTPTGEPAERYSSAQAAYRAISPFATSQEKPEKYLEFEFDRLGWVPDSPPRTVTVNRKRIDLSPDQQRVMQKASMRAGDEARALIRSPRYASLADEQKEYALRRIFARWHTMARQQMRPELLRQAKMQAAMGGA